jgi:hypothetical protein
VKILVYAMLPDFRKSIAVYGRFSGFDRFFFWYKQLVDGNVYGVLVE